MTKLNHHETLIYVMVAMSAVDRTMTDAEFTRIGQMVTRLPIFTDFDTDKLVETAKKCGEMIAGSSGLDETLSAIGEGIPDKLHATAYALAVEAAAAAPPSLLCNWKCPPPKPAPSQCMCHR